MSTDTHLTNEQIAKCAEAISEGKYDSLPFSLREHLSECEYCASEVMFVSEVSEELEDELVTDKKKVKQLIIKPWQISAISIAAAAAVLFFIITITDTTRDIGQTEIAREIEVIPEIVVDDEEDTVYLKERDIPETAYVSPKEVIEDELEESITEDPPEELLAAYEPNEHLEQLHENMKGVYRNHHSITINTPHTIVYEEEDSLRWNNPEEESFYLEFFNNKGEEIQTKVVEGQGVAIPELQDGLYYWKLISKDFDLLFVGKIIVK